MTTTEKRRTVPAGTPSRRREPGLTSLIEYGRVRNGSGLVSMSADGSARMHPNGDPMWSLRDEIISLEHFRANLAALLLDQRTILPCTRQDWESAARCVHDRRWASADVAAACKCELPQRESTV